MALKSYMDLEVWKKSVDLVVSIYQLTKKFPAEEKFGLTSQIKRSAVSIPSNIAEGYNRTHRGDYLRHLSYAKGSVAELETQIAIAARLNFIEREEAVNIWNLTQEIGKMLTKLIQKLSVNNTKP